MSKTFPISLLFSLWLLLHVFQAKCSSFIAPAMYIFGDSISDSGTNNFFDTLAKANYKPYGIDFPDGPTGRFTNGKTLVDFLAQYLGLPFVPPYMGLAETQKFKTVTGMNYASGSAGILQESGTALGKNIALQVQIGLFRETVNHYLPGNFKTKDELLQYLSNSIFVVNIGSNDYIHNYLRPAQYNSSHLYSPEQFGSILLKELKQHLQDLYDLGAKKFLVFSLSAIGCTPGMKARESITSGCAEDVNQLVSLYNKGFPSMLQELSTNLNGSTFVQGDIYASSLESGIINRNQCCDSSNNTYQCLKDEQTCLDRTTHIYWDAVHPTQEANQVLATDCFYGTMLCTPINVLQLAMKQ